MASHCFKRTLLWLSCLIIFAPWSPSHAGDTAHVLEMDDRVIEYTKMSKWIIAFYAPWCGHCKKLEPVWDQLAKHYEGKPWNVARVDATRYVKATNHFEIKAYPTIKFIYGKQNINYNGERKKDNIVDWLTKADGPHVRRLIHKVDYQHHRKVHNHFFLLVARFNDTHPLVKEYADLADRYFLEAFFFWGEPEFISKRNTIFSKPTLAVVKEEQLIYYESDKFTSHDQFIRYEQFLQFGDVSLSNFQNMVETRKMLLILIINQDNKAQADINKSLMDIFKTFTRANRSYYFTEFQFGYTENAELLNGIALWTFRAPVLFALNSTSYEYTTFDVINEKGRVKVPFETILNDLRQGRVEFFGGHSWFRTLRRPMWELYRAVIEMFTEAPIISLLIFGFPFGVISIVCYFLCCLDSVDDSPEGEDLSDSELDDDEEHSLREARKVEQKAIEKPPPIAAPLFKEAAKKTQ